MPHQREGGEFVSPAEAVSGGDGTTGAADPSSGTADLPGGNASGEDTGRELAHERETFLTRVTHDLKNPLTVIRAQAQIAQLQLARPGSDPAALDKRLAAIVAATDRIRAMLDHLADAARLESGAALDLDRQPADLVPLIGGVVLANRPRDTPERATFVGASSPLRAVVDRARLERALGIVVARLLSTAPEGGPIRVTIVGEPRDGADFAAVRVARVARAAVVGDDRRDSCDADSAASAVEDLDHARQIVEAHGGALVVEPEGEGEAVTVWLPLAVA